MQQETVNILWVQLYSVLHVFIGLASFLSQIEATWISDCENVFYFSILQEDF